jgi:hypothetical protein
VIKPDTTATDTTITWPDFSASVRSGILNKILLVKQNMQSVSLSNKTSYQRKHQNTATSSSSGSTESEAYTFAPLVGLEGTLKKWPVSLTYAWNYGIKSNKSTSAGTTNMDSTWDNGHTIGIKYEVSKSSGINQLKLLMWTIPVVGRLVTGVEGQYQTSKTNSYASGVTNNTVSTSTGLTPHASYDFTDNITGELKYGYTLKKDPNSTSTSNIFSLSVEIRFNP